MKKGDIFEVIITSNGTDGEGVAKVDDFVVFIPFVLVGEKVRVEVTFVKKSFAKAKVIKLIEGSIYRVQPECEFFRKCGGCDFLHVSYPHQLEIKKDGLENCLRKYARLDIKAADVLPSPKTVGYRNKVQLPFGVVDGEAITGFFKEASHDFVPVRDCLLQGAWASAFIREVENFAKLYKLSVYEERIGRGLLRHLVLRKIGDTVSVTIVICGEVLPNADKLIVALDKLNQKYNLHISINTRQSNVIMGDRTKTLKGQVSIKAEICGIKVDVSPNSFMQINDDVRDLIYKKVSDIAAKSGSQVIIDAFSGVGVLTNILSKYAKKLYGIEIISGAVADADRLARANGNADKIENICGDVAAIMPQLAQSLSEAQSKVLVVLDPPRKGCEAVVIDAVLQTNPTHIAYISCNPSTLSRDLALLGVAYDVETISPFDMFPNTASLETVVCLKRREN